MGFFDRFRRKHETAERTAPKQAVRETAVGVKKEEKEAPKQKAADKKKELSFRVHGKQTLLQPVVTEKAERGARLHNQYTFYVDYNAGKEEVKRAFASLYGVKPTRVNILRYEGEQVTFRRMKGMTRRRKKAIVSLPKGTSIDIVPTVVKE